MRKQLYFMNVGCIKHKLNLEFKEKDLGNANTILGMENKMMKRSKKLLLCQRQNLDMLISRK